MPDIRYECHGHIMMNGCDYRTAAALHKNGVNHTAVRAALAALQAHNVRYFRDGGDPFGVSLYAKSMAAEYGIDYVTPAFAIHRNGRYGGIVGLGYDTGAEYRMLLRRAAHEGCDFIKLMFSGIVEFDRYGHLSCPSLPAGEVAEMVRAAHGEGFCVMAHVNGANAVRAALEAGTDSIEHGYFPDEACLRLFAETRAVWVPTLTAVSAFSERDGFDKNVVSAVVSAQQHAVRRALSTGASVACGSDSGAVGVPHGEGAAAEEAELNALADTPDAKEAVHRANERVRALFRRGQGTL